MKRIFHKTLFWAAVSAWITLVIPMVSDAQRSTVLVIFPVRSYGIELSEVRNAELRQYLATRLTIEGTYGVMPESQVKRDLGSTKVESYKDCYEDACRIDLTKTVMADKFLSVDVTVESTGCRITAVLYDIAQEVTQSAADLKTGCTFDELKNSMVGVAQHLSSRKSFSAVPVQPVQSVGGEIHTGVQMDSTESVVNKNFSNTGILFVETLPPRAELVINGTPCGKAPYQGTLEPGLYQIVASSKPYYHDSAKDVVLTAEGARVKLPLSPAFGSLKIESVPEGADVYLEKIPVGKTPYSISRLTSGEYEVAVSKDLYKSEQITVTVSDGLETVKSFELVEDFGSIRVDSIPSGARVFLDNVDSGKITPIEIFRQATGMHVLSIELDGYGKVGRTIEVDAGRITVVSETLTPKLGQLVVMSEGVSGEPSECELSIDGLMVGTTPWKGDVIAKTHDLYLSCGGVGKTVSIEVQHNQQIVQKVVMEADILPEDLYWFQKEYMGQEETMPGGVWVNVGDGVNSNTENPFEVGKIFSVITPNGVVSSRVVSTELTDGAGDRFFRAALQWPAESNESFGLAVYDKSVSPKVRLAAPQEVTDTRFMQKSCQSIRKYLKHWYARRLPGSSGKAFFSEDDGRLISKLKCSKAHLTFLKERFAGNVWALVFVHIPDDGPGERVPFSNTIALDRNGNVLWSQRAGAFKVAYVVDLDRDQIDELVFVTTGWESESVWFMSWKDGLPVVEGLWTDGG